jgi:hypothetical protein
MYARKEKSKGTTKCPFCSMAVNNFHIGRHIAELHNVRDAASTVPTHEVDLSHHRKTMAQ